MIQVSFLQKVQPLHLRALLPKTFSIVFTVSVGPSRLIKWITTLRGAKVIKELINKSS